MGGFPTARFSTPLVASLLFFSTLASLLAAPVGADEADAQPCPGFELVPTQGPSCPIPGGWIVLLPDGTTAETHGPDDESAYARLSAGQGGGSNKASAVACVDDPTRRSHHALLYVHAADKPDRSAEMTPLLRDLVAQANGFLRQESGDLGLPGRYKFRCDGPNAVTVLTQRLPRADADTTFSTLIADLRAAGHNSPYAKYWVWYDGTRGPVYGEATLRNNDALTSANGNSRGNGFAVNWGLLEPLVFVHESAHTMGAVQLSAPHSSGAWHCTDGLDVLCYRDSAESAYDESACADRVRLDCGNDDYFHPSPPEGSYLATHWNLAHPYNRFLDFGRANAAPRALVTCTPAVVDHDEPTTCTVNADDDSDHVWYLVSVDGAPSVRHPATGAPIPGLPVTLKLSWSALGEHTVTAVATDDAKKPLASAPAAAIVRVGCALARDGTVGLDMASAEPPSTWENAIPRACGGRDFQLAATSLGADVDVCWHDALGAQLACHERLGDEAGTIPAGSASARIVLKAGASATYALRGS